MRARSATAWAVAAEANLGGVFVRDLLSPGVLPGINTALAAYRFDQPLEPAPDMALEWVARDGETILAQGTGPRFEFEPGDFAGTLTIEARVAGQVISSQTITISPPPTPTPTANANRDSDGHAHGHAAAERHCNT